MTALGTQRSRGGPGSQRSDWVHLSSQGIRSHRSVWSLQREPGPHVVTQRPVAALTPAAVAATTELAMALDTALDAAAQPVKIKSVAASVRVMQFLRRTSVVRIAMRLLLNLLWAVFGGGVVLALEYALAGVLCCITIVGIPFGLQCFKLAGLALFPFGKDFNDSTRSAASFPFNVLWLVFAGIWIFLSHLTLAVGLAVTIIGLPFAVQHVKLGMLALAPFGVRVREVP